MKVLLSVLILLIILISVDAKPTKIIATHTAASKGVKEKYKFEVEIYQGSQLGNQRHKIFEVEKGQKVRAYIPQALSNVYEYTGGKDGWKLGTETKTTQGVIDSILGIGSQGPRDVRFVSPYTGDQSDPGAIKVSINGKARRSYDNEYYGYGMWCIMCLYSHI